MLLHLERSFLMSCILNLFYHSKFYIWFKLEFLFHAKKSCYFSQVGLGHVEKSILRIWLKKLVVCITKLICYQITYVNFHFTHGKIYLAHIV